MLEVEHLSCGYGSGDIVKDVSFSVKRGECLGILGPNGCGKTTLLRGIAGVLPVRGRVAVCGREIRTMRPKERGQAVAVLAQMSGSYFSYTVYETVLLGRYAHGRRGLFSAPDREDRLAAEESLERVGLLRLRDRLITELSGGQLQRVFLARTFAQAPRVILLDEPTNHLDLKYQVELVGALREWAADGERCVVGVLHDLNLAFSFADTALLMEDGKVQSFGPAKETDAELLSRVYGMDVGGYMRAALARWEKGEKAHAAVQKPV